MISMVSSNAPLNFLDQDNQIEMQYDFFGYMMPLASHDTGGLSVVHGTDASTSTKGHRIPLNNHLNMPIPMVSLMSPSASWYCHVHAKN